MKGLENLTSFKSAGKGIKKAGKYVYSHIVYLATQAQKAIDAYNKVNSLNNLIEQDEELENLMVAEAYAYAKNQKDAAYDYAVNNAGAIADRVKKDVNFLNEVRGEADYQV